MDYYHLPLTSGFLVSQKALIVKNHKLLILKNIHGKTEWSEKWWLPGGLLEYQEDPKTGLAREVLEETGLQITVSKPFTITTNFYKNFIFHDLRKLNIQFIQIAFLCVCPITAVKLSDEHEDYKWIKRNQLKDISFSEDSNQIIQKYLKSN